MRIGRVIALVCLFAQVGYGQAVPLPWIRPQFLSNLGAVVSNGFLCTYQAGTVVNQTTYSENTLTTTLPNPIRLNSAGRTQTGSSGAGTETQVYVQAGANIKLVLYAAGTGNTCNGTTVGTAIWTQDNIAVPYDFNERYCSGFPGATAGVKIAACIADLPATGGIADVRGLEGAQSIASDIFSGITKPVELRLGAATYTLSANLTIPASFTVVAPRGASFAINNAVTLTINGDVEAGLYQIFSYTGTGTVTFPASNSSAPSRQKEVFPEWWGAVRGDNTVDSFLAISRAIASTSFGQTIVLNAGWYYSLTSSGPIAVIREGVSIRCRVRMMCLLVNGGATLNGGSGTGYPRNAYISIDVAASSTQLEIDGIRFHGFGNGVNFTGYGIRANVGNLIDSNITNNWFDLSSSSTNIFHGACVFTYWQNNVIELSNAGLKLAANSTACTINDLKSFKNYNELVYLDGTASNITAITIDGVEVNGHLYTGNRAFIDARGTSQLTITNVHWQNTDTETLVADEQRGLGISVSSSTGVMISNVNFRDNRVNSQEHLRYGIKTSLSDVQITNSTIEKPGRGCLWITGAGTSNVYTSNFRCIEPTDETSVVSGGSCVPNCNAANGDGIVIGESGVAVAGEIVLGPGTHIRKPRLRCVNGDTTAGTYNLTITGAVMSDSAYNNGVGFACVIPFTSGRVSVMDTQLIDTDGLSIMGPFLNLANSTGVNFIANNSFPGTVSGGNPKLANPTATTWLSDNHLTDFLFAGLPAAAADGSSLYCSNCSPTLTGCSGGGVTGAFVRRLNTAWTCGPVSDSAFAAGWDASFLAPTQNAVYDRLNSLFTGAATTTLTCGAGQAVKNIDIREGVVISASCGAP